MKYTIHTFRTYGTRFSHKMIWGIIGYVSRQLSILEESKGTETLSDR